MIAQRIAVNEWIRTKARFDGVIDFDRLMSGGTVYDGSQSLKPSLPATTMSIPTRGRISRAMGEFRDVDRFTQPGSPVTGIRTYAMEDQWF
jgi:hypothetical protein